MITLIVVFLLLVIILLSIIVLFKNISGYMILNWLNNIYTKYENTSQEYYPTDMNWCKHLRDNHEKIYNEYLTYIQNNKLTRFKHIDKVQTNYDISDIPWDVLFLRVYNKDTDKIRYFPHTYSFISSIPGCSLAMFSVLHPGKIIPAHTGPYKGVLRYHLALIVPKNPKQCRIYVNNISYNWKKGEDVLFDDTFLHSVKNESDETRVVLFLDIKKQFKNKFLDFINTLVLYFGKFNDSVNNIVINTNNS
jgi:aspartyl/asparaginyl beta-hydroxylase (cupin superfamily)